MEKLKVTALILVHWPMACLDDIVPAIKDAAGCLVHTQKNRISTLAATNLKLAYTYKKNPVYKLIGVVESLLETLGQAQSAACREIIKYAVVEIHIALYQGKQFFADVVDSTKAIPTFTCERERFIQNMVTAAYKVVVPHKKIGSHHRLFQVRLQQLICTTVAKCAVLPTESRAEDVAVIMEDCSYFSSGGLVCVVKLMESGEGYIVIVGRNQHIVSNSTWTEITETLENELQSDFRGHGYSVVSLSGDKVTTVTTPTICSTRKVSTSQSSCQPIQETDPGKM